MLHQAGISDEFANYHLSWKKLFFMIYSHLPKESESINFRSDDTQFSGIV